MMPDNIGTEASAARRVGIFLAVLGVAGAAATIVWRDSVPLLALLPAAIVLLLGLWLVWGGARAALWVRSLLVVVLAAEIVALLAAPLLQPLDLTLLELRLYPTPFEIAGGAAVVVLLLLTGIQWRLGRRAVADAIIRSGIRRWDMRLPARVGGGIAALAAILFWLLLHGQTAQLATSLAQQQLGPGYQYHLSWISRERNPNGTTVTGVVTAWNDTEIKTILLHWYTR